MKYLSSGFISTLIASAISGALVYWLSGWSLWACAFTGYLITELVSTANKVESIGTTLAVVRNDLSDLQKQNSQLSDQLWSLQEQIENIRVREKDSFSAYQ